MERAGVSEMYLRLPTVCYTSGISSKSKPHLWWSEFIHEHYLPIFNFDEYWIKEYTLQQLMKKVWNAIGVSSSFREHSSSVLWPRTAKTNLKGGITRQPEEKK